MQEGNGKRIDNSVVRKRVVIGDEIFEVPPRDIQALLEAKLLQKKPPATVEVVKAKAQKVLKTKPSVQETVRAYEELSIQVQDDVRPLLDRVALRILAELQDEEDAAALLLLI